MNNDIKFTNNDPGKGKMFVGLILLALGVVFLLHQFEFFFFPHWLFGWYMWLIVVGFFIGAKSNFRNFTWLILVGIGFVNLIDAALPDFNLSHFLWPLAIIGFGLWLILRRNQPWENNKWSKKWEGKFDRHKYRYQDKYGSPFEPAITPVTPVGGTADQPGTAGADPGTGTRSTSTSPTGDDYLDCISVFGGVKKTILSKDFKGGEIVNIFGGAELDFTMADINGRVIVDITQIFGGTKIIVPSNWQVVSDIAAVFAGIDDKRIRNTSAANSTEKILVLKGVSIFAGIDVRSY
jgi:predicted membrane protein